MSNENQTGPVRPIAGLAEISDRYDVVLCDVWGVLHNGVASFPPASRALAAYRRRGGAVVLITNAPRPSAPIRRQLQRLGVGSDAFDDIATSGDVTIALIAERIDDPVFHIGPARDLSLFEAAHEAAGRAPRLLPLEEARYALCTGLRDDVTETLDDYETELRAMAARGMPMICANPDIVIHRGDSLIYCAGALAGRYEALGGEVVYAGKPYPPIYARALALAERAHGRAIDRRRALAVGDGMKTDIAGAARAGLDALLVTRGIHRAALHGDVLERPASAARLERLCQEFGVRPVAAIGSLEG
ncbi:HAD superfamily hydrolase (TIGR01459 family) [Roseiarcus fermentans]|uniref:HAD superfamily hydrolase (TIGR01459 family) n=1 Tax=Roseiarcus fermentans TaxID=1473586 RepID=A0A366FNZ8_9HYPH|nr:TIGR01459 family HAD-type hydrolase [Roseiarcus fermentans]RBP16413.1 HAD superfamily hydrolase (TIGR01459 family) [Roseiarcus fermentans]